MRVGGVILAGGKSTRMGRSKAHLPFGPELMLQRVVRRLGKVVGPLVVVGSPGQQLPALDTQVRIERDAVADRGPLQGLAAGMAALRQEADAVFACSCDTPLLSHAFVQKMIELLNGHEIAVPFVDGYHHPLATVYRTELVAAIHDLLAADRRRPVFLFENADTRIVTVEELVGVDPHLDSLRNCNEPEDYQAALASAGFGAAGGK